MIYGKCLKLNIAWKGAFAQVEMKSLNKNTKLNERFRSSETVEKASLDETNYELSI